jgi:hypothetical protein
MNIETASVENIDGYPILRLVIDGQPAYVVEPKQALLDAGIVVLLDDEGHWSDTIQTTFLDGDTEILLEGATRDPAIVAVVRRFVAGETINLVN